MWWHGSRTSKFLAMHISNLGKNQKKIESKKKSSRHNEAVETRSILVDTKWVKNIFEGAL